MKELVTIQLGGFANFIGSHFWNFQDELMGLAADNCSDPVFKNQCLDMGVLYRTGETGQGTPTCTPRVVSVDLKGSLGSMSSQGTLYNEISHAPLDVVTWSGNVSTQKFESRKKNLFLQSLYEEVQESLPVVGGTMQNGSQSEISDKDIVESLETDVQCWTDFSKVHYHPRSLYELSGPWIDTHNFGTYGTGRETLSGGLLGEEINERLRFFVEECDHIQGFQFVVDDSGGFSAIAADFLENIADEYTNTPVLLYAARGSDPHMDPISRKQSVSRDLHDAISFSKLSSLCKLIVPVGLPFLSRSKASTYLSISDEKPYHCSAVYAAAIHSISLPFRMELARPATDTCYVSGAMDVNGMVQMLAGESRQNSLSILDVAMPAPSLIGNQMEQSFLESLQTLTPEITEDEEDFEAVESMTIHGAHGLGGDRASVSEVKDAINVAYHQAAIRPKFCHLSIAHCPLPIPLPFPSIFGNRISRNGELLGNPVLDPPSRGSLEVHSIPMAARLRSSRAALPFLEHRLGKLRRFGVERGAPCTELLKGWGFEKDELHDMAETLAKMTMSLDPYSQISSDSD